jgi:hypothetical protein
MYDAARNRTPEAGARSGGAASRSGRVARGVEDLLRRLAAGPPDDEEALKELRRVPEAWIPELLAHVTSRRPTRFYKVDAPAYHDDVARVDETDGRVYYFVRGMGRFYFDHVATGRLRGRRGSRVEFRSVTDPFPLGVVIRAGLLYRIASDAYPDLPEDDEHLSAWWSAYAERARRAAGP